MSSSLRKAAARGQLGWPRLGAYLADSLATTDRCGRDEEKTGQPGSKIEPYRPRGCETRAALTVEGAATCARTVQLRPGQSSKPKPSCSGGGRRGRTQAALATVLHASTSADLHRSLLARLLRDVGRCSDSECGQLFRGQEEGLSVSHALGSTDRAGSPRDEVQSLPAMLLQCSGARLWESGRKQGLTRHFLRRRGRCTDRLDAFELLLVARVGATSGLHGGF